MTGEFLARWGVAQTDGKAALGLGAMPKTACQRICLYSKDEGQRVTEFHCTDRAAEFAENQPLTSWSLGRNPALGELTQQEARVLVRKMGG